MKELQEIKFFLSKWVDPKTVFQLYNDSKNNPLGPQKVKNNPKIKSKEKFRIEGTIETSVALATESSVYVWSRAPAVIVNIPLFIAASKDKRACFMSEVYNRTL